MYNPFFAVCVHIHETLRKGLGVGDWVNCMNLVEVPPWFAQLDDDVVVLTINTWPMPISLLFSNKSGAAVRNINEKGKIK